MAEHLHICPLCEATCGLRVTIEDGEVTAVRGDDADVFSAGFICPKGTAIGQLHHDPDRLRTPMVRDPGTGRLVPASWDEAFDVIRARLAEVIAAHGPDSVALFLGNPNVHNVSSAFYLPAFIRALDTTSRYTASTVDQFPKQVASALMFGTPLSVAIPDLDRTDHLLILGANPLVSNGSMMTAPDMPGRLRALRQRGGRLVVVDPVRTRTARAADEHVAIRPGGDAFLLAAIANVLVEEGLVDTGTAATHLADGSLERVSAAVAPFTPAAVAGITGVPDETIRRMARELAAAPSAAVYGRMGTTTSGLAIGDGRTMPLGTVASWLVDVVNVLIGSLDVPGGVMWPLPPAGSPNTQGRPGFGRGATIPGRRRTRVRGLPSILGEFPAAALAEEIDTEGQDGSRIRALITVAGNPVVSTPDSDRLERALATLDLIVSLDAYVTETSRHADVILPAPSPLARRHFDIVFNTLAISNTARYSPAAVALQPGERDEADTLMRLTAIAFAVTTGQVEASVEDVDDLIAFTVASEVVADESSRAHGLEPADLLAAVSPRRGIERLLDLRLRSGPHGDGFGTHPDGLTLSRLEGAPHGIDLGPMQPRLPEVLRTPSGRIELAPDQVVDALADVAALLADAPVEPPLVLVGRRQLRSNNSWMHNLPVLSGGSNACTLLMNPTDAARLGVVDGGEARVSTATGSVVAPVVVTDDVRPGVVCLPHGWGHTAPDAWGPTARERPGVNVNTMVGSADIDLLSGTSVLAGIPVDVTPA
jgi:anaerobic selenocysteine-containing dehydrogenase